MRALAAVVGLCVALLPRPSGAAERPHVYLVVIDGLDLAMVSPQSMPELFAGSLAPVAMRTEARAAMPTRTNPSHATLLTGAMAESHGITGNAYWSRRPGAAVEKLDDGALLEMETLFTVAKESDPALVTMGVFSKAKLGRLFGEVPGRQRAPDVLWVPGDDGRAERFLGSATDRETMQALLDRTAEHEPDLAVVNLSEVDRTAHRDGPSAARPAAAGAARAVGALVADLRARGRWRRSVLIVTSDHGIDDVGATPARPAPAIRLGAAFDAAGVTDVVVASDGGVAHVYAARLRTEERAASGATLAQAAAVAWRVPGIAEVLARLPTAGVPLLADVHPDWGLAHERAGDLLVVAAAGHEFVEPSDGPEYPLKGDHGGPGDRAIPLLVAGGALEDGAPPPDRFAASPAPPTTADVGVTVAALLGLRAPRRFDGRAAAGGRPLPLRLRQRPH